jgi:putative aldouronate transport system substrate-binding protein
MNGKPAIYKTLIPPSVEPQNDNWHNGSYYPRDFRLGMVTDQSIDPFSIEGLEKLLFLTTENLHAPYINKEVRIAPPLKLTAEEAEQTSTIRVELQNYIEASKTKFIMGLGDIDNEWNQYLADLDRIGLDSYLDIMQTAYNRQFK